MSDFPIQDMKDILGRKAIDFAGNLSFIAKIKYSYCGNIDIEDLKVCVILNGWEGNQIRMDDGFNINSDNHHMMFSPEYQQYSCDSENRVFIISGKSNKMNGDYKVEIHF